MRTRRRLARKKRTEAASRDPAAGGSSPLCAAAAAAPGPVSISGRPPRPYLAARAHLPGVAPARAFLFFRILRRLSGLLISAGRLRYLASSFHLITSPLLLVFSATLRVYRGSGSPPQPPPRLPARHDQSLLPAGLTGVTPPRSRAPAAPRPPAEDRRGPRMPRPGVSPRNAI